MALESSGTMSIGGSTVGRSINLELDRSATATSSLGESALRTLAGVSSGAISISDFYGASGTLDTRTVTNGSTSGTVSTYGYRSGVIGSISDGTCNFKSGATIVNLYTSHVYSTNRLWFQLAGNHTNAGFTTMTVYVGSTGYDYARTSATYTYSSSTNRTSWQWDIASNFYPFDTTTTVVEWT